MSPRWIVALAAGASGLTIGVAHAATLGTLAAGSLASWNQSAIASTPTILTCDNFSLPASTGSALAGRPVQLPSKCGSGTWQVHRRTWTIISGLLDTSGGDATASISAGQTNVSAETTVIGANGGSRVAGIAINHTGNTRIFLSAVLVGPSTVRLELSTGGAPSTLASASATIGATTVVRITRNGSAVTVSVDGEQRISYTLSSSQISTLAGGTRVGLYFDSGSTIRFADILATTPASP